MTADFTEKRGGEPQSRFSRLAILVVALAVGGLIGFEGRSWLAPPGNLVVDGSPSTLHVYRWDPGGPLPQPRQGEAVIFKQETISKVVAELNHLPAFSKSGRSCDMGGSYLALSFDYNNGDSESVNVRPAPCGMVSKHGDEIVVADALGSNLYRDLTGLLATP